MEARFFQIQPQISFIAIIVLLLLQAYNDSLQFVDCSFEEFIREKEPLLIISEGFISSTAYSIPIAAPFIPVSSSFLQSQTEEISQMLGNVTFSSPPTSPQVTDDNQQPITSVDVTKDAVSE